MRYTARRWARLACWNLWPATRLLLVLAALAVWMHRSLGINPPSPRLAGEIVGGLVILVVVCALFCRMLARVLLVLLWFPFYAIVVLNWLFYDGSRLMVRQLIGPRSPCVVGGLALASELGLFMSLANSVLSVLKIYCHF
jgi:hypothetical protein